MEWNQNGPGYMAIGKGSTLALVTIALLTLLWGACIHWGWSGWVKYTDQLNLLILCVAWIAGSVWAGMNSVNRGWQSGIGVVCVVSILLWGAAGLIHQKIDVSIYLLKLLIHCFIGAFSGIIGINIVGK